MTKKARAPQHIIDALLDIERHLSMKSCSFSPDKKEDEKIKSAIRNWIETWSLEPLRDVRAWAEGAEGRVVGWPNKTPRFQRRLP